MARYDLAVVNGLIALPAGPARTAIGIRDGRIVEIGDDIAAADADDVVDAAGRLVLPGAVDPHFHLGIYRNISEDTKSETLSSLVGGVTSIISYFRTGHHYLDRSGPYDEIFPQVLEATAGRSRVDFGYHLAPMLRSQIAEIPALVERHGVTSFKYYMFYKGLDLAGTSLDAESYTMAEHYDLGHLYEILETAAACHLERNGTRVSVSIHCEQPELIRIFMERVQANGRLRGLVAYSAARPPLTEHLAIAEVGVLAGATSAPINLLHLSSAESLEAALGLRQQLPEVDMRLETTLHHLALTHEAYIDQRGKVNPPIRSKADRERLWQGILRGELDWVCSDHACCSESYKEGDLWKALPGFGGTALMYPFMLTEGLQRGLSLGRVVKLCATNAAQAYGLYPRKGEIRIGADADLAIIDMERSKTVTPELLLSAQEYTPFEGMELTGWPVRTILRGSTVYENGEPVGDPVGEFLRRPLAAAAQARVARV
jgi:dihydroorotase-like cyclic amidohydrolase